MRLADDAFERRDRVTGQRRVIDGRGRATFVAHDFSRRAGCFRHALEDRAQARLGDLAHLRPERADRARHRHVSGDDVVALTAVNAADRHDPGLVSGERARADGLQRLNECGRRHDGIDGELWPGAVRLPSDDLHLPGVGRRERRSFRVPDVPHRHFRERVQSEDRLGPRVLQDPFLHHQRRAAGLPCRRSFFGGLEDELHRAGEIRLHRRQHGRHAEVHGRVHVVSARVHHADVLSHVRRPHLRRERQAGLLGDGQRVDVGANRHDGPGAAAFQQRDDTVPRDAGLHFEAELSQVVGDERRRLLLAVRQLGVLVQVMPDLDDRRRHLGGLLLHARKRILRGQRRARQDQDWEDQSRWGHIHLDI